MPKRILLADDSVTIQKVVELTFMDEDYEVVAVSNGDDAVARLAEVEPDLVIADVHMPGANGYEVCRRVKQWRSSTPVLLLVGTFEPFQEDEAKRASADGHLKKPFDSQELLRRSEDLIRAAESGVVVGTPADEMQAWQPVEEIQAEMGEVYAAGGGGDDEPAGPLGERQVSGDLELEASPWTQAEESSDAWAPRGGGPAELEPLPEELDDTASRMPEPLAMPVQSAPSPVSQPMPSPPAATSAASTNGGLSETDVDRIARRVIELLGDRLVREVAWEVVPDMAELVIKDRLRELERQLESP